MSKIKAVLFDLDGTLINTLEDLAAATNYALENFGYEAHKSEEFKMLAGEGVAVMLERAMPPSQVSAERVSQLKTLFLEYYSEHYADKTTSYTGVPKLVRELKIRGYLTAVVTNKVEEMAKVILNKLYPNCFDLIYGQRDGVPSKPDPALALMAMEQLGVTPEECAFVGDSGIDILTAVNSGAMPVGVLWGFRDEIELRENGARNIIKKADQLLEII